MAGDATAVGTFGAVLVRIGIAVVLIAFTIILAPWWIRNGALGNSEGLMVAFVLGALPFFLYVAYTMPHVPLHASVPFRGRSRAGRSASPLATGC